VKSDEEKKFAIARMLLAAGADPNELGDFWMPDRAAFRALTMLLDAGANLKSPAAGEFLLRNAGSPVLVDRLIAEGVDVNFVDARGATALKNASMIGVAECVNRLLQAGAQVNAGRETALMHARDAKTAQILLAAGANPQAIDEEGRTAYDHAVHGFRFDVARLLYDRGFGRDGTLRDAAVQGDSRTAKALIEAGAGIDEPYNWPEDLQVKWQGPTPLVVAAGSGSYEIVELLIDRGSDPKAVTRTTPTPLVVAGFVG
jgi:ankyrin repeat protein